MISSSIRAEFNNRVEQVWKIVTSPADYGWRRDVGRTEVVDPGKFIEYTKDGFATTFVVTACEEYRRWAFDLENSNMKGSWTGLFQDKGDKTVVEFCEEICPKKWFMRPFAGLYLRKQQADFIEDLRRELDK